MFEMLLPVERIEILSTFSSSLFHSLVAEMLLPVYSNLCSHTVSSLMFPLSTLYAPAGIRTRVSAVLREPLEILGLVSKIPGPEGT